MYERTLASAIKKYKRQYPVIGIVGPRQSGKTTLAGMLFKNYEYVSLENLDYRRQAEEDPRGFFADRGKRVIIDEAQRVPGLFSYLQEIVDKSPENSQYVLTGSQQFLLLESISQSLAGRIATFHLYPFTWDELAGVPARTNMKNLLKLKQSVEKIGLLNDLLFTGFYPRIHDKRLEPRKWLENYVRTYVERDIRTIIQVGDLGLFETFLISCAARSGNLINLSSIANTTGVSIPTVKRWLSLLETSGIVFLLRPHSRNFGKRLVKTPKLYFLDTGLLCFLLSIRNVRELAGHPLRGQIYETFIISELVKRCYHLGDSPPFYFWRDKTGNEVDLLIDMGMKLFPVEIKSASTYNPSFTDGIHKWSKLAGGEKHRGIVLYAGKDNVDKEKYVSAFPWQNI